MDRPQTVLVTGGTGYIGSHTCLRLLEIGYHVVVVDNLTNSNAASLDRVRLLGGDEITFHRADVRDREHLLKVFRLHDIDAVIHFAAMKHVGESVHIPLEYYDVNVAGTVNLLDAMSQAGVSKLVFSSSCSVYGDNTSGRLSERAETAPVNPYARTKLFGESIIADQCDNVGDLTAVSLRYFNPIGAHPGGMLGESPIGSVDNIMPTLLQVASGTLDHVRVYGGDYPTPDGTPVRDYVHVLDVAGAHTAALQATDLPTGLTTLNVGTGKGTSVLQLIDAIGASSGKNVPYSIVGRRLGDVPELVADPTEIERRWSWKPEFEIQDMCADAWRFQVNNPAGYGSCA